MNNKLVSIITPMYNARETIIQTMESVMEQTYEDWEMIIVDDCSTDGCADIVDAFVKRDKRIRYYRQHVNQGVAAARNTAINMAQGRYVAFLDSDDLWHKDKLQKQLDFMEQKNAVFSYTACEIIDEQGETAGKTRYVPGIANYDLLLKGNFIPCLTVVLDRKYVDIPKMPSIRHEDYAVWLAILKQGILAYGLNEVLAKYRINTHSISGNKLKAALWTWNIYYKSQKLGFFKSCYYFINYIIRAVLKRV